VLDNAAIRSFYCEQTYDSERHTAMEYILFIVHTDTQKYRGIFEWGLRLSVVEPALRAYFQYRYALKK
jgi:hypothetical protein